METTRAPPLPPAAEPPPGPGREGFPLRRDHLPKGSARAWVGRPARPPLGHSLTERGALPRAVSDAAELGALSPGPEVPSPGAATRKAPVTGAELPFVEGTRPQFRAR